MKRSALACLLVVAATTLPALADVHEGIGVNAIDRSIGAMTKAGTVAYFIVRHRHHECHRCTSRPHQPVLHRTND